MLKWYVSDHAIAKCNFLFVDIALTVAIYCNLRVVHIELAISLIVVNLGPIKVVVQTDGNVKPGVLAKAKCLIFFVKVAFIDSCLEQRLLFVNQ